MQMTPVIAVHMTAALLAVATGPVALWARRGRTQRPRLHRAFGYAWVTLMLVTTVSAIFIRDFRLPNLAGYTPIHLLVPVTLVSLFVAFWKLAHGNVAGHAKVMKSLYLGACVVAGAFTLLPDRYLGQLVWGQAALLLPILRATPVWVWGLLAGLVVLGLTQVRDRTLGLPRVAAVPVALTVFSLWGAAAAFGRSPLAAEVAVLWLLAATGMAVLVGAGRSRASYDPATRLYAVPGSWVPLVLILSMFAVRYVVNVRLARQPQLVDAPAFALTVATLYGAFSGLFIGRTVQLWRLALRPRLPLTA